MTEFKTKTMVDVLVSVLRRAKTTTIGEQPLRRTTVGKLKDKPEDWGLAQDSRTWQIYRKLPFQQTANRNKRSTSASCTGMGRR